MTMIIISNSFGSHNEESTGGATSCIVYYDDDEYDALAHIFARMASRISIAKTNTLQNNDIFGNTISKRQEIIII